MTMIDTLHTASLEVLNGTLAGKSFPLHDETLIGRCEEELADRDSHIRLPDSRVSRQHARIIRRNGVFVIQDLDSTNGTLLNARPLTPKEFYALREGSNLQLGGVHLRFRPPAAGKEDASISSSPWESEIGGNEEAFDLALIAGEAPAERQASSASLVLVGSKSSKPDLSMAIDAKEALRLLKVNLHEDRVAATDVQRRLRALAQVSIGLGGQNNHEDLLATVMGFIFDIFPAAEHAYGLLCNEPGQCSESLKPVVAMSRKERSVEAVLSRAIVNEVISGRRAILSSDASSDKRFDSHESIIGLNIRSVMCVPLLLDDEVLGLIQVDTRSTHAFDSEDLQILSGIGVQAAIALKNLGLVEDIRQLFEGFVTASVHAIEARDPSTAGHSFRVAEYSQRLAEAVGRSNVPELREVNFTREQMNELRYAALLHDFGKVGVREHVLTKSHKLYPRQFELMQARFQYACASMERHAYRELLDQQELETLSAEEFRSRRRRMERGLAQETQRIRQFMELIVKANEPAVFHQTIPPALQQVVDYCFPGEGGEPIPLLSEFEMEALTLARGSLTPDERQEIEYHVSHTYAFLQHIPWTKGLASVPEIAYSHHEKLDGSGYPRGLGREQIPLQARIMTVTDIYDALTSGDRPYKQSLPEELALDILRDEAARGKVEMDLVDIFIDSNAYRLLPER